MSTLVGIVFGMGAAFAAFLIVGSVGSVGPVELVVVGLPAFVFGYWLAKTRMTTRH